MNPPASPGRAADPGQPADILVLDEVALGKLRELDPGGRAGVLLRVLRTYESTLGRLMVQFDAACTSADPVVLRHVAHTLFSSSASIGALAFAQACKAVELHIRDHNTDDITPKLDTLRAESLRVAVAVRAMLAQPINPA